MASTRLLQELNNKGLLKKLFREGVISYKVFMMLPIRNNVDALMRQGKSHGEAVVHVAQEMDMTRQNIYNYL